MSCHSPLRLIETLTRYLRPEESTSNRVLCRTCQHDIVVVVLNYCYLKSYMLFSIANTFMNLRMRDMRLSACRSMHAHADDNLVIGWIYVAIVIEKRITKRVPVEMHPQAGLTKYCANQDAKYCMHERPGVSTIQGTAQASLHEGSHRRSGEKVVAGHCRGVLLVLQQHTTSVTGEVRCMHVLHAEGNRKVVCTHSRSK